MDQDISRQLNERKETLNNHLAKFNQLKNEGRWTEAWNQLLVTLNYASETLKFSSKLIKDLENDIPDEDKLIANNLISTLESKTGDLASKILDKAKEIGGPVSTKEETPQPKKMIVIPKHPNIH